MFSGDGNVESVEFRDRQDTMHPLEPIQVGDNFSLQRVEDNELVRVHMGDVKPSVLHVQTLIVEANRGPWHWHIGNLLQYLNGANLILPVLRVRDRGEE